MKSQEAMDQTEGTSARVLRQERSQRGWNKINKAMTGDARHQGPECIDIMHIYPFTGEPRI